MLRIPFSLLLAGGWLAATGQPFDLVIKGGHVIDPRNSIDGPRDVAIANRKIARVAAEIPASEAKRAIDAKGLFVTPGLIDIHVHVYAGTGMPGVLTGDSSVYPDGMVLRAGVTTVADAGTAGWRNFGDFKQRVIDRAQTRVLAFVNIAGLGMQGKNEADMADMEPGPVAQLAKQYPEIVVGVKTAHYPHADWTAVENAVKAGTIANVPVMVDFGANHSERPISALFRDKLRPGDIYTHVFSGLRNELLADGNINPALFEGRQRGILFDIGHGSGSFQWNVATAAFRQNFPPDTISSDLHTGSMNGGMKDMANIMSKVLSEGVPLAQVIRMSTWAPALAIKRPQYGHLSEGAGADVAIFRQETGEFGYLDSRGTRKPGRQRLTAEMTIRDGSVVWDLNGRAAAEWETFYKNWKR